MKHNILIICKISCLLLIILLSFTSCAKPDNPIKFPKGTFPDTVSILTNLNTQYDDYNSSVYQLTGAIPVVFSSNRRSSGGQFDVEQSMIAFTFDQGTGQFLMEAAMTTDPFLDVLLTKARTAGNDFGPYRLFSSFDGNEYFILSSVNSAGNLDLFYLKNLPQFNSSIPDINGPFSVRLMNTDADDAYICFDTNLDSAYFTTNKTGNFEIVVQKRPLNLDIASWFNLPYVAPSKVDSINSLADDKCPLVWKNTMVFTSNRPGGLGGFDLYYSTFRNGKWSSPVNMGPGINTSYDEYRPILGYHPDFTNWFMMFSSNRTGGKGGFDLYFTGISFPEK